MKWKEVEKMAKRIAQFYKVGFHQFAESWRDTFGETEESERHQASGAGNGRLCRV